jgi:hypothetical protein
MSVIPYQVLGSALNIRKNINDRLDETISYRDGSKHELRILGESDSALGCT